MKNTEKHERISAMELLTLFMQEGAIGKKLIIDLIHPLPEKMEFVIQAIKVEDADYINDRFSSSGSLDTSSMIGTVEMKNNRDETVVLYFLEDCFYFTDREESVCEQCSANGYVGAECPFHMDMMSYHCPCNISLELKGKILIVESNVDEV